MPTFEKTIFTNLGIEFLNSLNSGRIKLVNATSVYSTTDLSGMSDDDIRNMTDIQSKDLSAQCDIVKIENHQTKIRSIVNNEKLNTGIYIRSYATYFTDDAGNQTLFAVKVNTRPQYLVAFDGVNTNSQSYGFNVGVSQTDNVQFTKLSNLTATIQDLKAAASTADSNALSFANSAASSAKSNADASFATINNRVSQFTINNSYTGTDMYAMPPGIWRLNNEHMINTPYGDDKTIIGTVINYGWYTTYVDKTGNTYVTSPESQGWHEYASQQSVDNGFEYHGIWNIPLSEFKNAKTGVYQLDLSNEDAKTALSGWDGYGAAIVYHNGVDCYVTIYGHNGLQWNNHTINNIFGDWVPLPTQDDLTNIWNQIRAIKTKLGM